MTFTVRGHAPLLSVSRPSHQQSSQDGSTTASEDENVEVSSSSPDNAEMRRLRLKNKQLQKEVYHIDPLKCWGVAK